MGDVEATAAGQDFRGYRRGTVAGDPVDQYVVPVQDRITTYEGYSATFITPGRGAARQVLHSIHNAAGSPVIVDVARLKVDVIPTTAAVAITVVPPVIRLVRFNPNPGGGTALAKGPQDTTQSSSTSVVVTGDASADNTGSGTAMTVTTTAILNQTYAPRMVQATATAANAPVMELIDTAQFLYGEPNVILRAGEGLAVVLDAATATTGNPTGNRWVSTLYWSEYTRP